MVAQQQANTCPQCGIPYLSGELSCSKCGFVFKNLLATRRVDPVEASSRIEWGTHKYTPGDRLILFVGESKTRLVVNWLGRTSLIVGRSVPGTGKLTDVDLANYGALEAGVSREHAKLSIGDGQLFVEDLGSANGTYLNGARLGKGERKALLDGNDLKLGRLSVQVIF